MNLTDEQKTILYNDFEEIPVDWQTFLLDDRYLGKSWVLPNGTITAYPAWLEAMDKIYPLPARSPYNTVLALGATGTGKTTFLTNMVMVYYLYIVLCLKNPHEYFGLSDAKPIDFCVINIVSKTMAYKNAWGMINSALIKSPWFMARGGQTNGRTPEWFCTTKPVRLSYGKDSSQIIGLDILCCMLDEISFYGIKDQKAAAEHAKVVFNTALNRMTSRFTGSAGIYEGLMLMASSKKTDQAFAEEIANKLLSGIGGEKVYVVDKPRWEIKPKGTYSDKTFPIAIGDNTTTPTIIQEQEVLEYKSRGYEIIRPPMDFYDDFDRDMAMALAEIAGRSVSESMSFLKGAKVKLAENDFVLNLFTHPTIQVGNKDSLKYSDFADLSRVAIGDRSKPLFIHLDASLGDDGNTITGVVIDHAEYHSTDEGDSVPQLHLKQIFRVKVVAPKNDRVMLRKNEQFIYWLRDNNFNIKLVSSDKFQSVQFGQDLTAAGIPYKYQSIDKVDKGVCLPYQTLRNFIYDLRIKLIADEEQFYELTHLIKLPDGHIDKPAGGHDDISQALCGAVYAASLDLESYSSQNSIECILNSTSAQSEALPLALTEQSIASSIMDTFSMNFDNSFTQTSLASLFPKTTKGKDEDVDGGLIIF